MKDLLQFAKKYTNGAQLVMDWLGSGGKTVSQELAQGRSDVCTGRLSGRPCPENVHESFMAESAGEAIRHLVQIKNDALLRVDGELHLGGCAICKCHMRTKIWTPMEQILKYTEKDEMLTHPIHCWIRKENKL